MVAAAADATTNADKKIPPTEFPHDYAHSKEDDNLKHTVIRGRWDQYRSPFWSLAVAAIGTRYGTRPFTRQWWNPEATLQNILTIKSRDNYTQKHPKRTLEILNDMDPKARQKIINNLTTEEHDILKQTFNELSDQEIHSRELESLSAKDLIKNGPSGISNWEYRKKYAYAGIAGFVMSGVTGYYAIQTYRDIKNIFAETVAWELNKKPEDVTFWDLRKSNNIIVQRTMSNFISRNLKRAGLDSIFFWPFIPKLGKFFFKKDSFIEKLGAKEFHHAETPLDFGVAGTSAYLLSDVISRKISFFEQLQSFADRKINHMDSIGDKITAEDLISLYDRHARDRSPHYTFSGRMDTPRWRSYQVLFSRVAELMNQTYGNTINNEQADFTVPKLIYLLGQGLIRPEKMEESLALIEVASKENAMPDVKKMADLLNKGVSLNDIAIQNPELSSACERASKRFTAAEKKEREIAAVEKQHQNAETESQSGFVEKVSASRSPVPGQLPPQSSSYTERVASRAADNARNENAARLV